MARAASNPLTLPRFGPYFQVSILPRSSYLLCFIRIEFASFKPSLLKQIRLPLKQNPPTRLWSMHDEFDNLIEPICKVQEKVLAKPDRVKDSTKKAATSSVGGGFSEFPKKYIYINRRIAVGSTFAGVGIFFLSRLDFGVSLKDLSAEAVPYEEALSNGKPLVVEFYADKYEVCWELAPDIYKVEQQYRDSVNFVMLNVDNTKWGQELDEFGVEGIPHFAFLDKDGNERTML